MASSQVKQKLERSKTKKKLRVERWVPRVTTKRLAMDELTLVFIVPRFASTVDGLKDAGLDPREMDIISASSRS